MGELPEKVEKAFAWLHEETCDKHNLCSDEMHERLTALRAAIREALEEAYIRGGRDAGAYDEASR